MRLRGELDRLVGDAMVAHRDWEPDAIVQDVWDWVDARQPSRLEKAEQVAERDRFLQLSPNLFGGGALYGELDTVGFATVAEALDAPLGPPVAAPDDLSDQQAVDDAFDQLDTQRRALTLTHGTALADRLVALCEDHLAGHAGEPAVDGSDRPAPRPLLLATIDLEALLDRARTPGWLLHTLAGGRMKVSTGALQRLADERGADLRTIVLDDTGEVVGVGQRTRIPPRWLREAIWARDTCVRDPDGTTPVRRGLVVVPASAERPLPDLETAWIRQVGVIDGETAAWSPAMGTLGVEADPRRGRDGAAGVGSGSESLVQRGLGRVELFGQGHVDRVVGRDVRAQLPAALPSAVVASQGDGQSAADLAQCLVVH